MHHDLSDPPCKSIIWNCYLHIDAGSSMSKPKVNNIFMVKVIPSTLIFTNYFLHCEIVSMALNWTLGKDNWLSTFPVINEQKYTSEPNSIMSNIELCISACVSQLCILKFWDYWWGCCVSIVTEDIWSWWAICIWSWPCGVWSCIRCCPCSRCVHKDAWSPVL